MRRRAKDVPGAIVDFLAAAPDQRFTPYDIAMALELSVSSVTYQVSCLIRDEKINMYGEKPLVVGL